MTNFNNTTVSTNLDAAAVGRTTSNPFVDVFSPRDPTPQDTNYPIQKKWLNTNNNTFWMLEALPTVSGLTTAIWIKLGTGFFPIEHVFVDAFTFPGTNPVDPDALDNITITGAQVPAGTTSNVIRTDSLAAHVITVEVQRSQAVGVSTVGDNGVSHFDSAAFQVDGNGWVQVVGGGTPASKFDVDAHTAPGTDPVIPDGTGTVTITGSQVPAGTTANAIRTDSLAANTYAIEIQRSQAVPLSTIGDNGISHFDSATFSVDGNGFVQLAGGTGPAVQFIDVDAHAFPGTDPVVPSPTGHITVTGGQIVAGSTPNVIRSDSLAPNSYTIEIQRSQAVPVSTVGDNGVCHFDSSVFGVDANGFVTFTGASPIYYSLTPYIVGPDIHSQYATIQAAINQAVIDGASSANPKNIYIKPQSGGYTENPVLSDGINLIGLGQSPLITGTCSLTSAGTATITGLNLVTNSNYAISITGVAASTMRVNDCIISAANNTAINLASTDPNSSITCFRCFGDIQALGLAIFNVTGAGALSFVDCDFGNSANSITPNAISSGAFGFRRSFLGNGINSSGTSIITMIDSFIQNAANNSTCITAGGSVSSFALNCGFASGTAVCISAVTAFAMSQCVVASDNVNAIDGAGSITLGIITFIGSSFNITTAVVNKFTTYGGTII